MSTDFAWSFVTQVCSSGTNFALTLLAARVLGPSGVGVVYIGFVSIQLVIGLHRAAVTQPLIADAAARAAPERRELVGRALTMTIGVGILATAGFAAIGVLGSGNVGRGFLLFAPWVAAALVQEYLKSVLFQENLARAAALSDAGRLATFALAVPLALASDSDVAVVAAWGAGSVVGTIIAFLPLMPSVARLSDALTWFRTEAWHFGRWLAARELMYQASIYATVLSLAAIIGTGELGGLRAAETVFSPFSFVAAALVLPALPALSRALVESRKNARDLALRITAFALGASFAYALLMLACGGWLLTALFGEEFAEYDVLVWPFVVSQLVFASAMPLNVLLMAERRGGDTFVVGVVLSAATLIFPISFAATWGVEGAAWGLAAAAIACSVCIVGLGSIDRSQRPVKAEVV